MSQFQFGETVKDSVTGFQGVVTARYEFMNGCVRYMVERLKEDGGGIDELVFDEQRLRIISRPIVGNEVPPARPATGGARPSPPRTGSR